MESTWSIGQRALESATNMRESAQCLFQKITPNTVNAASTDKQKSAENQEETRKNAF